MAPVVLAVELCVIVAAVALSELSGVVPPTAPVNVVVPLPPVIVSACAPFKVEPNVMFAFVEVILLVPVTSTGTEKFSGLAPDTVMLFAICA